MTADILMNASGDVEWGATLLIIDWGATFSCLAFLAAGLLSYYAVRNPGTLMARGGAPGLVAGTGFGILFSAGCFIFGSLVLTSGTLPTPNGECLVGDLAYAGGCGFLVLGLLLVSTAWRSLRSLRPVHAEAGGRGKMGGPSVA